MGLTTTPIHATLSPHKERRNREFFLVMACSAVDLGELKSGILRELREFGREFCLSLGKPLELPFPANPAQIPAFPGFSR